MEFKGMFFKSNAKNSLVLLLNPLKNDMIIKITIVFVIDRY